MKTVPQTFVCTNWRRYQLLGPHVRGKFILKMICVDRFCRVMNLRWIEMFSFRRLISGKFTTNSPRKKVVWRNFLTKDHRTRFSWWNSGPIWVPTSQKMSEHFTPSLPSKFKTTPRFFLNEWHIVTAFIKPKGTKATRIWRLRVRRKSARLANKSWRKWKRNTLDSRTDASSTASIGRPCASTWSTLSTSSNTCQKSTWWTASSRTLPSCRYLNCFVFVFVVHLWWRPASSSSRVFIFFLYFFSRRRRWWRIETRKRRCSAWLMFSKCPRRSTEPSTTFTDWWKIDRLNHQPTDRPSSSSSALSSVLFCECVKSKKKKNRILYI